MEPKILIFVIFYLSYHDTFGQEPECECVPFYLCENGVINTNGESIIDIRIKPVECPSYLEICCKKNQTMSKVTQLKPSSTTACGIRNPDGVGYRIVGDQDNEAQFGEFPWTVAIFEENQGSVTYKCGGSLIHPEVVLTAAHCVQKTNSNYVIRAGEWDSKTTNEIFKHQDVRIKSTKIHQQFYSNALYNDIALVFLNKPFQLSDHIRLVCLPSQNSISTSDKCIVNGWGKNKYGQDGVYQNILKKIELPMVAHQPCEEAFRKTRLGQHFQLHPSFVCAGGRKDKDSCQGDGGGPLTCPIIADEGRYQLYGLVAWGIGCGTDGVPGAYVNVAMFRNWIDIQMREKKLDTTVYQYTRL